MNSGIGIQRPEVSERALFACSWVARLLLIGVFFCGFAMSLGIQALGNTPPVVINEVLFFEEPVAANRFENHDWLELYNTTDSPVDLEGWTLLKLDGTGIYRFGRIVLPPDRYLIVHFDSGIDNLSFNYGWGEVFSGHLPSEDVLDDSHDGIGLFLGEPSSSTIIDFLTWKRTDQSLDEGPVFRYAVQAGIWTDDEFFNPDNSAPSPLERTRRVAPGTSIGRDRFSSDEDEVVDWDVNGGMNALQMTPGEINYSVVEAIVKPAPPPLLQKAWTVMVYLDGDNNLEPNCWLDLNEMEIAGGTDGNVNVVVMFDLAQGYMGVNVSKNGGASWSPTETAWRGYLGSDSDPNRVVLYTAPGDNPDLGERNMGDGNQLRSFAQWGMSTFPARHYALILWDHGAGWKGTTFDDFSSDDSISMKELRDALAGLSQPVDILGFDQCLMAMVEVAHQVDDYADVLVASEEVEDLDGWPYDLFLQGLKANPNWTAAQFGSRIVQDYHTYYTTTDPDPFHTLSAVSLGASFAQLVQRLDIFGDELEAGIEDYKTHLQALDNVQIHIKDDRAATEQFDDPDYIDIWDFSRRIAADRGIPNRYKTQATPIVASLAQGAGIVIAEEHGNSHSDARGLSIYFPESQATELGLSSYYDNPAPSRYPNGVSGLRQYAADPDDCIPSPDPAKHLYEETPDLRFRADTNWDEFLHRYYEPVADAGPDLVVYAGQVFTLDGSGSSDSDGVVRRWIWDFDATINADGSDIDRDCFDETNDDNDKEGMTTPHSYAIPGVYTAALTVWDNHDQQPGHGEHIETDEDEVTITVLPAVEIDEFPESWAEITFEIEVIAGVTIEETVELTGPTIVEVYFPAEEGSANISEEEGLDWVETQMVQLDLTGHSPLLGPIEVRLRNPEKEDYQPSYGSIVETENITFGVLDIPPFAEVGTAISTFDIYFEVELLDPTQSNNPLVAAYLVANPELWLLHNEVSLPMTAEITSKPPGVPYGPGNKYTKEKFLKSLGLLTESGDPSGVAMKKALHIPVPPPEPCIVFDPLILPIAEKGTGYQYMELGVRGGTLTVASIEDPMSWNGITSREMSTSWFTNRLHRGLINLDHVSGAIAPDFAKSWEISGDGKVITFHLRCFNWSDGVPITADDVVFTYNDLILNEDVDTGLRDGQLLPDNSYPVCEKIDDHTVSFTMSVVFRPVLHSLIFPIMPKHALAQYVHKLNPAVPVGTFNETWTLDTPLSELVGNGPWIVSDYQPNVSVTMTRNEYYYGYDPAGTQLPYYDTVVSAIVANQDVSMLKFRNGETDVYAMRPEDIPILLPEGGHKGFQVLITDQPVYGTTWFMPNQDIGLAAGTDAEKREVYRNVKFRQALAHTIDKDTMIQHVLNGLGGPQWSPVSVPSPFYAGRDVYGGPITENNAVMFEYDPAKAAGLLDEIGVIDADGDGWRDLPSGDPLVIELNSNDNTVRIGYCLILQDDWREVGLNATFQVVDFDTLVDRLFDATGDIIQLGLTGGDEPNIGSNVYRSCGSLHAYRYSACNAPDQVDIRIDELLALGASTFDLDEAFAYYTEYQQLLADQLGYIYLVARSFQYAYYDHVGNAFMASPTSTPDGTNGLLTELCFDKRLL